SYTHNGTYPLIGRQGALCGNINISEGSFYATEHAVVVTAKKGVNVNWLFYQLVRLNLNQYATGQAQPGLSVAVLDKLYSTIPHSPIEQQKIADYLSSIDELITAENKKLDMLKKHKKGLMQQLFPTMSEL
ncbi:restriction endonuclease subunit S, partial [Legionella pneumophila]|nr:restriction endonuclease subunit S [Legionella pneumophila]